MIIPSIDIHAVDHCNYSCQGCNSSSNLVSKRVYQADEYIETLKKLETYCEVESYHILGGEPTLHPNLAEFISKIKKNTPAKIRLITNGWWFKNYERLDAVFKTIDVLDFSPHPENKFTQEERHAVLNEINIRYGIGVFFRYTDTFVDFDTTDIPNPNTIDCFYKNCLQLTPNGLALCFRVAYAPQKTCSQSFNAQRNTGFFDVMNGDEAKLSEWLKEYPECCKYCIYWNRIFHNIWN